MLEAIDYSSRRGVIVPMMDMIYDLIAENIEKDKQAGFPPLENKIIWKQRFRVALMEIERRWVFVMEGKLTTALLFYRFSGGDKLFIDELMVAWPYRNNKMIFPMLLDKFRFDDAVKKYSAIYAGERVRVEENAEILAAAGFKGEYENGYQLLGSLPEAVDALKMRYTGRSAK
ncbi:MAG: hypothetical protein LBR83_04550 [Clostridiales bacterium]|jgi:hypothetical protein|nr:hypothetical protein [Clostridiales bacterium]